MKTLFAVISSLSQENLQERVRRVVVWLTRDFLARTYSYTNKLRTGVECVVKFEANAISRYNVAIRRHYWQFESSNL